jgi:hypothetical protein
MCNFIEFRLAENDMKTIMITRIGIRVVNS